MTDDSALSEYGISDYLDMEVSLEIGSSTQGYVGIGYGNDGQMNAKDVSKLNYDLSGAGTYECQDSFTINRFPIEDSSQDLYDCQGSNVDGWVIFTFKKPLETDDEKDFDISDTDSYFIAAYNTQGENSKHDPDKRTSGLINWMKGDVSAVLNDPAISTVRFFHGTLMIVLFLIIYPLSVMVARFLRHFHWWRELHIALGSIGTVTTIISGLMANATISSSGGHTRGTHNFLGITCVALLCIQVFIGDIVNNWLLNRNRDLKYIRMKNSHRFFGYTILLLSPLTCYFGWQLLQPIKLSGLDNPFVWYTFLITIMLIGEGIAYYVHYKDEEHVNKHVYETNFHMYSWDEISERVTAGAIWMVIDGYVYDLTNFVSAHPGGKRILLDYAGTDCTAKFYGEEETGDSHGSMVHKHSNLAIKQMAKFIVGETEPHNHTNEEASVSENRRGQVNKQSSFTDRMFHKQPTLMGKGKNKVNVASTNYIKVDGNEQDDTQVIVNNQEIRRVETGLNYMRRKNSITTETTEMESFLIEQQRLKSAKHFRSARLLSKTRMTDDNCERPIHLYELDISFHGLDIQPGEYVMLHYYDNNPISRAYTPIVGDFLLCNKSEYISKMEQGKDSQTFKKPGKIDRMDRLFLLIRNYKQGRMSTILRKSKPGTDFRITGPFVRKTILPVSGTDYGYGEQCFRRLLLLAGGTGFAPMIDPMIHHLFHGNEQCKVLLIWYNKTAYDTCCGPQFEYFVNRYKNRFSIDMIFNGMCEENEISVDTICQQWKKFATVSGKKWTEERLMQAIVQFWEHGTLQQDSENGKQDDDDSSSTNQNDLHEHDRLILSGPKLFVESILNTIKHDKSFDNDRIGKQIICCD